MESREQALATLSKAYQDGELALYLGAGVSVASGLPTWEKLVLAMYFSALTKESLGGWRPFPNYLFAIAEWHLGGAHEPLEITARKIRQYYADDHVFLRHLRETLYAGFAPEYGSGEPGLNGGAIRGGNRTIDAVARICERRPGGHGAVNSVISYNYDNLLEVAVGGSCQPVFASVPLEPGKLPIYHVHGYVPFEGKASSPGGVVFTEEQYHLAAQDAYSWANLVQIQCMSSSIGLMIGLSLSDRNMRRLLDAVSRTPIRTRNYAFLQEPKWLRPDVSELSAIDRKAREYINRFESSGVKWRQQEHPPGMKGSGWQDQIIGILDEVRRVDVVKQTSILEELGIRPIWYKEHEEIPAILNSISSD